MRCRALMLISCRQNGRIEVVFVDTGIFGGYPWLSCCLYLKHDDDDALAFALKFAFAGSDPILDGSMCENHMFCHKNALRFAWNPDDFVPQGEPAGQSHLRVTSVLLGDL